MRDLSLLLAEIQHNTAVLNSITACANADVAKFGEWQADYYPSMMHHQTEHDRLVTRYREILSYIAQSPSAEAQDEQWEGYAPDLDPDRFI